MSMTDTQFDTAMTAVEDLQSVSRAEAELHERKVEIGRGHREEGWSFSRLGLYSGMSRENALYWYGTVTDINSKLYREAARTT